MMHDDIHTKIISCVLLLAYLLACMCIHYIVVQQEKVHQNLLNGVEHFDKSTMKHAMTQEKNSLPDTEGIVL